MKIYRYYGLNTAIDLLRPNAKYSSDGRKFLEWNDDRPCPSWEEVMSTMQKIKEFEDSFETTWTEEQLKMFDKLGTIADLRCNDGFHYLRDVTSDDLDSMQTNNSL